MNRNIVFSISITKQPNRKRSILNARAIERELYKSVIIIVIIMIIINMANYAVENLNLERRRKLEKKNTRAAISSKKCALFII